MKCQTPVAVQVKTHLLKHLQQHKPKSTKVVYKLGVFGYFILKNQTRKIDKIHKDVCSDSSIHASCFARKCADITTLYIA